MNKYYLLIPTMHGYKTAQANTVQEAYDKLVKDKLHVRNVRSVTNTSIFFDYVSNEGVLCRGSIGHQSVVDLDELEELWEYRNGD